LVRRISQLQRLELQPLARQESLALVESLLRRAPQIPQALRELIIGGAEGIPFYIEEIIKMFIDQKSFCPDRSSGASNRKAWPRLMCHLR